MDENLFLTQFQSDHAVPSLGLEQGDLLAPLKSRHKESSGRSQLDWLLSNELDAPRALKLEETVRAAATAWWSRETFAAMAPVGTQDIWAAGVTYKRSEEARESESNNSNIYRRVYSAERPELFFKSAGIDVVPSGESIGIRYDALWSVPEPELVVVLNAHMEVVGFTIGNDVSSRDIEGANPLYLPQAKMYDGSCAIGPRIWLQPGVDSWPDVEITIKIEREGETVFNESTSTRSIHRPMRDLIDYLGRCKGFPRGVMLFTGTGIVPPDDFTLIAGDTVRIRIDPIGELVNTVKVVGPHLKVSE